MRRVIITQNIAVDSNQLPFKDEVKHELIDLISFLGFIPILVPNTLVNFKSPGSTEKTLLQDFLINIQPIAIIFSGGNDLGSLPVRDATELSILQYAMELRIPILGICRGMQLIASNYGIETKHVKNHVNVRDDLIGELHGKVNSYHNYSISKCPDDFHVLAKASDGEIEAIKHVELPWEAWMWHPERENPYAQRDLNRIRGLLKPS